MKKTLFALLPAAAMLAVLSTVSAQTESPTINVYATLAPNAFGSPSFDQWAANGLTAMEDGLTSYGAAGPTQFNVTTNPLPVADNIVTGYPSWLGQADPTGVDAGEFGNRASFVTVINGNGSLISINNMGFSATSSDAADGLGFAFPDGWTYDADDIGIIDNPDGTFTYVTGGDPDTLVNEIISIGVGNAYASYDTVATGDDDPDPTATDQQILDYDLAQIPSSYDFTGTFTYGDASGSATFDFVSSVPDSSSSVIDALVFGGVVFVGLSLSNRSRKRRRAKA